MKKIHFILFLSASVLLNWHCGNNNTSKEEPATVNVNKKREAKKKIKTLKEFKIGLNDTLRGFLINEEIYNEKGLKIKSIGYDYYGSGAVNSTTEYAYNDKDQLIKYSQTDDGVTTTTVYTYNDEGKAANEQWSRPNGENAKTEYFYKDGRIAEEKHYDAKGKYEYSRIYEYTLDEKGRVINEKKIEKYANGNPPLEQYNITYSYYDNDSLKEKKSLRGDGSCCASHIAFEYDLAGNLVKETEYNNGVIESITLTYYNQYGEFITDSVWNGNKDDYQYSNYVRWDEFGTKVFSFYKHIDGTLWGSRYEVEYW